MTESRAINNYIIHRSGKNELLGNTAKDQALVECVLGVVQDVKTLFGPLFFDKGWKDKVKGLT